MLEVLAAGAEVRVSPVRCVDLLAAAFCIVNVVVWIKVLWLRENGLLWFGS